MRQPMAGVRVLDFTMFLAGPYATRLMADAGAEVIKVEPPAGDYMRVTAPNFEGASRQFAQVNCGKKSLELDLKDPEDWQAAMDLAAEVDVVVENFRPGVMDRLGLGYEAVKALNPNVIYCSVSGYGQTGPGASKPAFAPVVHAYCGFDMELMAWDKSLSKPPANRNTVADILAATHAYGAIATALFARERAGGGERIDVTLVDCMHNLTPFEFQAAQVDDPQRGIIFEPIRSKDGFLMIAPIGPANFLALTRAIGCEWMQTDERFIDPPTRVSNWQAILGEAENWALEFTAVDAAHRLEAEGCPAAPYRSTRQSIDDEQTNFRDSNVEIQDAGGAFVVPNTPFRFFARPVGAANWVAKQGANNEEMLGRPAKSKR
ncbi:MAG: CoA transferase [Alphaproteobacteria bacterium]|nr:CoA transferase [Alphaproteobacteria bacterium]